MTFFKEFLSLISSKLAPAKVVNLLEELRGGGKYLKKLKTTKNVTELVRILFILRILS